MNLLFKVHALLVTVTIISAVTPASAITRIGNAAVPQVASCICRGKVMPPKLCPVMRCIDEVTPFTYSSDYDKALSYRIDDPTPR